MTPEQWARIQELFQGALEQPVGARDAWLSGQTADPLVIGDVRALLRADESDSDGLIGGAIAAVADSLQSTDAPALVPSPKADARVGAYRLEREIARGGMGAVWLAVRADDAYQARVAIKFVRDQFASPGLADRLRAERQILANLTHPNIAWLLDGGTAGDGTPYLVMEYIDGVAIDEWCDRANLGLSARVALFTTVCEAVRYAHAGLVIHRDIKPSNVLVTRDGTPKLVDFGTAKLLAGESQPDVTATMRFLTPNYAAPEQVLGQRITVATDVHALGGLLYKLVTGSPPHDVAGASAAEIERRICEVDPRLPSQVASEAGKPWARRLVGDLDTIILTALHRDPARRYESVDRLVDDLRRHAEGRPVLARPDSWTYRAGRFIQRHTVGVTTAAAVVLALAGLVTYYTVSLRAERDKAATEAANSAQVANYLVSVLFLASPQEGGKVASALDLMNTAVRGMDSLQITQPALYANLLQTAGQVYREWGDNAAAEPLFRKLVALDRTLYPKPADQSIAAKSSLATTLQQEGQFVAAESLFVDGLNESRRLVPIDSIAIAFSLNNLAKDRLDLGHYREAEAPLAEAAAIYEKKVVERHIAWHGVALRNLARAVRLTGDLPRADSLFTLAIPALKKGYASLNPEHPNVSSGYYEFAALKLEQGDLDSARALAMTALGMRRRGYPHGHPTVGRSLVQLAAIDREAGRLAEAGRELRQGDSILVKFLKPPHPWLAEATLERAQLVEATRGARAALPVARRAVAEYDSAYTIGNPETLRARIPLAQMLGATGDCREATATLDSVIAGLTGRLDPQDPWLVQAEKSRRACRARAG